LVLHTVQSSEPEMALKEEAELFPGLETGEVGYELRQALPALASVFALYQEYSLAFLKISFF
jgi:hypothetical protein